MKQRVTIAIWSSAMAFLLFGVAIYLWSDDGEMSLWLGGFAGLGGAINGLFSKRVARATAGGVLAGADAAVQAIIAALCAPLALFCVVG